MQQKTRINDYYLAMVAPGAREPSKEEYQEIVRRSNARFKKFFQNHYKGVDGVEFVDLKSEIDRTSFGKEAGIPSEKYNILIKFAFLDVICSTDSETPPDKAEILKIMKSAISKDFVEESIRSLEGSPFESTTGLWLAKE